MTVVNLIEKKYLVKEIPPLNELLPVNYERYILKSTKGTEIRIQKRNNKFELEVLTEISALIRVKLKKNLTSQEFDRLKNQAKGPIIRDSYLLSHRPKISIYFYKEQLEGLVRVEVEFENTEEAKLFKPLSWFGQEITDSPLGRDSKLILLSQKELSDILRSLA